MNESCHTHMNESCHTHMNESCHTHMDESCHTHHMNESYHAQMNPRAKEIGLEMITTTKISTSLDGVPMNSKHVFPRVPQISNKFLLK